MIKYFNDGGNKRSGIEFRLGVYTVCVFVEYFNKIEVFSNGFQFSIFSIQWYP